MKQMAEKKVKAKSKKTKSKKVSALLSSENLHTKCRPSTLADYVGQEDIAKIVQGWFKRGRVPSTICITGTTGCGKTTLARILARMINCETHSACGKCRSCKAYTGDGHQDVTEANMGKFGKVEDTRTLIDTINFMPYYNKRIFILDEVHLMSKAAASALLIPLEEPPEHTIWILCTTDPEKLLDTVRNRCTTLAVKPIDPIVMAKRLFQITKGEGIKPKGEKSEKAMKGAMTMIANYSEGQMRKGISILDQVLGNVSDGAKFTKSLVEETYASSGEANSDQAAVDTLASVLAMDLHKLISTLRSSDGIRQLVNKLIWLLDWVIGNVTKTNKYAPAIGKMFIASQKKEKFTYNLLMLLQLQDTLCKAVMRFNTIGINERIILEGMLARAIKVDYDFANKEDNDE